MSLVYIADHLPRSWYTLISRYLPHSIDDGPVAVQTNHFIFLRDVMKKRILVISEEGVRDPDFVREVSREGEAGGGGQVPVGQSLVRPILVQVYCDCVVLQNNY